MRSLALCLSLLIAACGDSPATPSQGPATPAKPAAQKASKDLIAPPQGITPLQKMHKDLETEVAKYETLQAKGKLAERDQRMAAGLITGVDKLITVAELAMKAEARNQMTQEYKRLRKQHADLVKERTDLWDEIQEVTQILDEAKRTNAATPEGFTVAELDDKMVDFRKQDEAIIGKMDNLVERMRPYERKMMGEEEIPTDRRTLFTDEYKQLVKLRARAAALMR